MTIVKNLEVYGLDPAVVATALQHRVQASTVLQPVPGAKDKVLVQIQGNQILQVGNLLLGLELSNIWIFYNFSQTIEFLYLYKLIHSVFYLNFRSLSNSSKVHPRTRQSSKSWQEEVAFQGATPAVYCFKAALLYVSTTTMNCQSVLLHVSHVIKLVHCQLLNDGGEVFFFCFVSRISE